MAAIFHPDEVLILIVPLLLWPLFLKTTPRPSKDKQYNPWMDTLVKWLALSGPGSPGVFLCGVYVLSQCLCGFSPGALGSCPKFKDMQMRLHRWAECRDDKQCK
ncbi:unnamed protein product [Pleuronectes platessa]|uniref:Uncharacterized protein n=1 Tax=Pleuronectes platessa TaxID=8262 RepID=A0A9N7YV80_PLEPL|nr:unnamed protein product [Pleuronectes platessa]